MEMGFSPYHQMPGRQTSHQHALPQWSRPAPQCVPALKGSEKKRNPSKQKNREKWIHMHECQRTWRVRVPWVCAFLSILGMFLPMCQKFHYISASCTVLSQHQLIMHAEGRRDPSNASESPTLAMKRCEWSKSATTAVVPSFHLFSAFNAS